MHISVLLEESIENLKLNKNSIVVDATLGRAGHSSLILKNIPNGHLYAFDQDKEAIEESNKKLKDIASNYTIIKSNFVNMKQELNKLGINKVDAILFDLGVSSPQLDEDYRGFSFHNDAYLDMRMDLDNELTAHQVVNNYTKEELTNILYKYGDEKFAPKIATKIIENRPINTTLELVEVIKSAVPERYKREKHPARKVFQAIRIEVNNELEVFEKALKDALELLNINGRICVITFHSLEDRICKNIFKSVTEIDKNLKNMPVIPLEYLPNYKLIKTIEPSNEELEKNNRSRSAKLRIIERIK